MKWISIFLFFLSSNVFSQLTNLPRAQGVSQLYHDSSTRPQASSCLQVRNPVKRNIENQIRQYNTAQNLNLPRYCMDRIQRLQYREILRNDPTVRRAAQEFKNNRETGIYRGCLRRNSRASPSQSNPRPLSAGGVRG